jgi:hypothetical protein
VVATTRLGSLAPNAIGAPDPGSPRQADLAHGEGSGFVALGSMTEPQQGSIQRLPSALIRAITQ